VSRVATPERRENLACPLAGLSDACIGYESIMALRNGIIYGAAAAEVKPSERCRQDEGGRVGVFIGKVARITDAEEGAQPGVMRPDFCLWI